jgi:hypothetical protein
MDQEAGDGMNEPIAPIREITLRLSIDQARRLYDLLEGSQLSPAGLAPELESFEEKLGDASTIAHWLGENVRLDVPPHEADAARRFLHDRLGSDHTLSLLDDILTQLSSKRSRE